MISTRQRPARPRTWPDLAARVVTEVLAPSVLIVVLFLAVGLAAGGVPAGLLWGLAGALFSSIGPTLIIVVGVRRGRWGDRHLSVREHRTVPLLVGFVLVIAGLVLLVRLGAPPDIVATQAAMLAGVVVSTAITQVWKISFHAGVAAAVAAILTLALGPLLVLTYPLLGVLAWARVHLGDHTGAQVLAALPIGALTAGVTFLLTR